jgi:hypothetical protein
VWTSETKSLLPSPCKREEFPLFGKEGLGEILATICFSIMDSVVILLSEMYCKGEFKENFR